MVTFETEKDFMDAVMAVLAERLEVSVHVTKRRSYEFYNNEMVTEVEVSLSDSAETPAPKWGDVFTSASGNA